MESKFLDLLYLVFHFILCYFNLCVLYLEIQKHYFLFELKQELILRIDTLVTLLIDSDFVTILQIFSDSLIT